MSKGYLHIDLEWLSAMTLTEAAVYGWLLGWSKHTKGPVSATYGDIATALSMSVSTVKRAVKQLTEKGVLRLERGQRNSYKVKKCQIDTTGVKMAQQKCQNGTIESAKMTQDTLLNINKSMGSIAGGRARINNNDFSEEQEKQETPDSPSWPPEGVITNPEYWKNATIEAWQNFYKKKYNTVWTTCEPQVNALRDLAPMLRDLIEQRVGMVDYLGAVRHIEDWYTAAYTHADNWQRAKFEPRTLYTQFNSLNIKIFNNGNNTNPNDRSSGSNISADYLADILSKIGGAGI